MQTVLVTGGTGLVGTALTQVLLQNDFNVIVLGRGKPATLKAPFRKALEQGRLTYAQWDPAKKIIEDSVLLRADHIVNLAGAGVADKRWSAVRKKEILDSRVDSGNLLAQSLIKLDKKPVSFIQASAIGWYGPDQAGDSDGFQESAPVHSDYLGNTCKAWEESSAPVESLGIRRVILRIGIVLSKEGGALKEFLKPLRFGMAAIMGNGKQLVSWIEIGDLCSLILEAIRNEHFQGVFNAVAPSPVCNRDLTMSLAKQIRGRFFIPFYIPAFFLKIMLGEMSIEVLKSTRVSARKIQEAGFRFSAPTITAAFEKLFPAKS